MSESSKVTTNKYFCKKCRDRSWLKVCECNNCEGIIPHRNQEGRLKYCVQGHNSTPHVRIYTDAEERRKAKNKRTKIKMRQYRKTDHAKEVNRTWREKNSDRIKQNRIEWEKRNPKYDQEWRDNNREQYNRKAQEYRRNNREHFNEYAREYWRMNPEKRVRKDKKSYSRHRTKRLTVIYEDRRSNPEKYKEYRRRTYIKTEKGKPISNNEREYRRMYMKETRDTKPRGASRYTDLRNQLIIVLGGKCTLCGFDNIEALQIDHKDGSGFIIRKYFKNIVAERKHYLQNSNEAKNELQVLCANCHVIKTFKERNFAYSRKKSGIMYTLRSIINRPMSQK